MYQLLAVCPMGLESIVAKEVQDLGYDTRVENGRIYFEGDASAIVKANLWLRTADRVKLIVGQFEAVTFDSLFEQTKNLPWEQFIPTDGQFPVQGRSLKSKLFSVPDVQAITKKAIVERLKNAHQVSGWLDESGAKYPVEVAILKDKVLLTIDTSGSGLNKRGYRLAQGEAPIKETLAASLVKLANWTGDTPLIDPFCGSGTIAIEACLIAQNIAPGFNRSFISEQWDIIPKGLYDQKRAEADELADYDKEIEIYASDIDPEMVEIAQRNADEVGVGDIIRFEVKDVNTLTINHDGPIGLIGNPPYGERIGDRAEVEEMYGNLGILMQNHPNLSLYIMTSNKEFEYLVNRKATKRRKLFNGYIETTYYQYWANKKS
ncbi:THUMP domain-containing class I SAM-dependent RNA methyltransferase [Staphylococcus pseudintermedius]|uniref:THUMP domain-containing class I SAM-dependent RNA methyltransferase n=1 Tax=Staphylococcus pseudintermedius TaxID=283734 RepID=UPI0023AEAC11|nr:class I SAM-dependent RNA methyltransferase [Staphylococcus pseudintermedius]EIS6531822.1 class I SAM-dependent RNA methyltransferase [Staphylococcus pseudintermedius]EIS6533199.1 class I SAM-dependent RNA methyltransferase [Staphylococcus pseudintermedius]ELV2646318.1 class I SAM-dependent RNA methyltransferase [Staphylococcus pseudintermedius]ELV3391418.1 class I SAM-dependent RNA methyltransferase [Staphylococcus pseudintermedius]MDE9954901.1 class I SAM-dependent RNA methyltransferase [